ncbi:MULTISPECIES: hypothetical protein [Micromonospora]|uniref:hypothetical protein n=1 Tax=Micromonospora TaxID=1873 RepID=UPI00131A0825|nr:MULTISPECIES: hypothetical protein [Micromonospora]NES16759.1 hypothetical protein [Micromonospora sp. PPF5-17B]NES37750.1 hypothetical protein [Micromonospora solifontis]NES58828.1 hypothetical protein [Micromonospora sp. PPF5-6]
MSRSASTLGQLWWQWLPTSLGSSMLVLEIPVVAAAVARSGSSDRAIAALGIAVAVIVVVNGPALALAPLVVTLDGRYARRSIHRYALAVGAAATVVVAVLGLSRPALAALFSLDAATTRDAGAALLALAPASLVVAIRRYLHGRFIALGATGGIGVATGVRLIASATFAWCTAPFVDSGAAWGAGALTLGACAEATTLALRLRRVGAAEDSSGDSGDAPRAGAVAIGVAHLPMAAARMLNMVPQLITTIGIAHAAASLASLAAWPILYGLLSLFTGPMADYETVGTAALRRDPADPVPRRLGAVLVGAVTVAYGIVLFTPLHDLYLRHFSQLTGEPLRLALTWSVCTLLIPAGWVVRGYLRARAMGGGRPRLLAYGVGTHLAGLVSVLAGTIVAGLPGVACAALAVFGGVLAETVSLAISERRHRVREVRPERSEAEVG